MPSVCVQSGLLHHLLLLLLSLLVSYPADVAALGTTPATAAEPSPLGPAPSSAIALALSPTSTVALAPSALVLSSTDPGPAHSSGGNTARTIALAVTLPVVALLVLAAVVMRKTLVFFFKKHFTHGDSSATLPTTARGGAPAMSSVGSSTANLVTGGNPTRSPRPPPSGVTVADRPVDQQRPPRRTRRRRSVSPVGLPLYSEEPGEEEMSLFKHQEPDMSSSRVDLSLSTYPTGETTYDDTMHDSTSEFVRPSFDLSSEGHLLEPSTSLELGTAIGRPRSASDSGMLGSSRLTTYPSASNSSSPFASQSGFIDVPINDPSPSFDPPGSGHRATRSSPVNRLTPPSSPPRPAIGRPRASTLQRVLGRSTGASSSSGFLPLGVTGRSPYGQTGGGASTSMHRLATSSSASINSANISSPLPNSFVHSSFVFPRSGPTPQQIAFISSRESLGAYGYGSGVAEPPAEPPAFSLSSLSPTPDRPAVQGRGRSASSVSQASRMSSSPLARPETPSPPPSIRTSTPPRPASRQAEEPSVEELLPTLPPSFDGDSMLPSSPPSSLAPATSSPPQLPALSLSLSTPGSNPPAHGFPFSRSVTSPSPKRIGTSSPPPAIVTLPATPVASTAPSPLFPLAMADEQAKIPAALPAQATTARARRSLNISTISEASFMTDGTWSTARPGDE
ncbi:hypothetical protein JCM1841_006082 [Sporobolomyces salmonicolor]